MERDLQHSLRSIDGLKPRNVDRVRVDFDAYLTFDKAPELPVFIRDLSSQGFQCRCSERLAIGSSVTLRIPDIGQFSATVAWQLGVQAGARFDTPLPLPTVLSIVLAVVQEEPEVPEAGSPAGDAE